MQVRRPSDDAIAGTGVVVSMAGKVVTCAHVVDDGYRIYEAGIR